MVAGPTVLVIGAARSGTTALVAELATHPELYAAQPKEPHFLALHERAPLCFSAPGDDVSINAKSVLQEDAWRALFRSGRGGIDGSVSTLYYAEQSVESIRRHCPDAALIAILRRPSDRAFSAYRYQVGRGWETETFERALELEDQRVDDGWHHLWHYRRMGCYGEQLEVFAEAFGANRLLVLDHADFEHRPAEVLAECARHIGVDPSAFRPTGRRVNQEAVRARPLVLAERALRRSGVASGALRTVVPRPIRDRLRRIGHRPAGLDPAVRARLDQFYAADTERLAGVLGERAPRWARGM